MFLRLKIPGTPYFATIEGKWSAADNADGRRFEKLKQKHQGFFASEEMRIYERVRIDIELQQLVTRKSERERMIRLLTKRAVALELMARHDLVCKGCPYRPEDAVKSMTMWTSGKR